MIKAINGTVATNMKHQLSVFKFTAKTQCISTLHQYARLFEPPSNIEKLKNL